MTAQSEVNATQRVVLLGTATWGLTFVYLAITLFVLALPFVGHICKTSTEDEFLAKANSIRTWITVTAIYSVVLASTTALVCRRRKRFKPDPVVRPDKPHPAG